ncbi:unnamed protein product, partial [Tuber aestivum]
MGSTVSTLLASTAIFLALPPGALATDGVDFSNNLFSDLGPLLALFGEQVAKQFMSQSMSWLEDVIFAMAPLGIITAITGAVRVAGPIWLKAVVGRARESGAAAEMELMSSTSHQVCELWNGEAIVRVMGSPEIAEILYFEEETVPRGKSRLFTFETATEKLLYTESTAGGRWGRNPRNTSRLTTSASAPNISLNFCEIKRQWELWLFALLGVALQSGSLVFIGVVHYHPGLRLKEKENSEYAYPLMASGTLLLVLGMMACSHVVQASSIETTWVADKNFKILWLQKSSTVNDQLFGSYAIFGEGERRTLTTSRHIKYTSSLENSSSTKHTLTASLSFQNLTIAGSFISIVGFVTQFVGIRALHWSAPVTQLGVTLAMTAARTWIRRNMSARPGARIVPTDYEIDWLAVKFGTSPENLWESGELHGKHDGPDGGDDGDGDPGWEVLTMRRYGKEKDYQKGTGEPMAETILKTREELGRLTKWKGLSHSFALELTKCLRSLLTCFVTSHAIIFEESFVGSEVFRWTLQVEAGQGIEPIDVTATRSKDGGNWLPWDVSSSELCAIISLWSYGMSNYEQAPEDTPDKDRSSSDHGRGTPTVLRVLGSSNPLLIRDCEWWMDRGGRFVVVDTRELENAKKSGQTIALKTRERSKTAQIKRSTTEGSTSVASHRIVGTKPSGKESLVFASEGPLRRMCAQEILSSFMWEIAGVVRSITGKTESRTANPSGIHESEPSEQFNFKLENAFFRELAEIITESGVTSNHQEAYALIIPPFSEADKLP